MFVLLSCVTSVIGNTWGYLASAAGGRAEYAFAIFLLTVFPFMIFNGILEGLVFDTMKADVIHSILNSRFADGLLGKCLLSFVFFQSFTN